jgi:histidine triad (HIT) family protein
VSDCIFCRIVSGEAERSVVYEDEVVLVMMDLQPVNPGHSLVLPKRHAALLAELDEEATPRLFVVAVRAAAALRASPIRCEGVNLFLADGAAAGQEVDHVHVHVLPRFAGDPFRVGREGGRSEPAPRAELDALADQLRAAW